jgi:hypothetical protein
MTRRQLGLPRPRLARDPGHVRPARGPRRGPQRRAGRHRGVPVGGAAVLDGPGSRPARGWRGGSAVIPLSTSKRHTIVVWRFCVGAQGASRPKMAVSNRCCVALLYGRAGHLTAQNGGLWPAQRRRSSSRSGSSRVPTSSGARTMRLGLSGPLSRKKSAFPGQAL